MKLWLLTVSQENREDLIKEGFKLKFTHRGYKGDYYCVDYRNDEFYYTTKEHELSTSPGLNIELETFENLTELLNAKDSYIRGIIEYELNSRKESAENKIKEK